MPERKGSQKLVIHEQLQLACRSVLGALGFRFIDELADEHFIDPDTGEAIGEVTNESIEVLGESLRQAVCLAFARAKIDVPKGYAIEQAGVAEAVLGRMGNMHIGVDENQVGVMFDGPTSIVRKVRAPVDFQAELQKRKSGGEKPMVFIDLGNGMRFDEFVEMPPIIPVDFV